MRVSHLESFGLIPYSIVSGILSNFDAHIVKGKQAMRPQRCPIKVCVNVCFSFVLSPLNKQTTNETIEPTPRMHLSWCILYNAALSYVLVYASARYMYRFSSTFSFILSGWLLYMFSCNCSPSFFSENQLEGGASPASHPKGLLCNFYHWM